MAGGRSVQGPLVDNGHAAGEQAGGLDGHVASTLLEQRGLDDGEDGEHVVHRRPGDFVVAGAIGAGEERQQLGQRGGQATADRPDALDALGRGEELVGDVESGHHQRSA